jgi:hypothetical protein
MNTQLRNAVATRLFINAMTQEYGEDGVSKPFVREISNDALWASTIFVEELENFDAAQADEAEQKCEGCNGCSPEEDEAFTQLERALKEQFLNATLHAIFKGK